MADRLQAAEWVPKVSRSSGMPGSSASNWLRPPLVRLYITIVVGVMVVITYSYNYSYKVDKLENFTKVYGYNEVLVRCGYNGIYGDFLLII